jgi:hypothetical protein
MSLARLQAYWFRYRMHEETVRLLYKNVWARPLRPDLHELLATFRGCG